MKIPEITSKRYHAFAQLITEAAVAGSQEELYAVVSKSVPKILGIEGSIAVVVSDQEFELLRLLEPEMFFLSGERAALDGTAIQWPWSRDGAQRLLHRSLISGITSSKRLMGSQFIISPMTTARGPIGTFNIGLPEGVPIPDDLAEVAQTVAKILASHLELHTNIEKLERTVQQLSNAQDQLVEQAKNAALGEMLSGLAHEVNTPLSVVGNAISLASDSIDSVSSMMLEGRLTRDGFKS